MPRTIPTQLRSWSVSRYHTWATCPAKAKYEYIDKLGTGEKSPALVRGAAVHEAAEHYLKDVTRTVPKDFASVALELRELKKLIKKLGRDGVILEDSLAFRADWSRTTPTDWTGAWVRIKIDVATLVVPKDGPPVVDIFDWKTGKFRDDNKEDYLEQLELYALAALLLWGETYPDLVVRPKLVYVDHAIVYPDETAALSYTMADLRVLKTRWEKRVKPMLADKRFPAKPNRFCNWCAYGVSKGGSCKFG